MKLSLAPMEGVTGYVYRNAYHAAFDPADIYVTPFVSTNQNHKLSLRELKDILPEHNRGMHVIPQILSNKARDFVLTAEKLEQFGYHEVNLNLGCPAGTVVAKGRGSGFLAYPEQLDRFFDEVFDLLSKNADIRVSVKTRLGKEDPEEMDHLMDIYNRYPLTELIIHPRVQKDFYKNTPNLEVFRQAAAKSKAPVCYNGNIFSKADYYSFSEKFPQITSVMLGRGVIANPALIGEIRHPDDPQYSLTKEKLYQFHDHLYKGYQAEIPGGRNVLFKMKEVWGYLSQVFEDSQKDLKRIRKAESVRAYEAAVNGLFEKRELA